MKKEKKRKEVRRRVGTVALWLQQAVNREKVSM